MRLVTSGCAPGAMTSPETSRELWSARLWHLSCDQSLPSAVLKGSRLSDRMWGLVLWPSVPTLRCGLVRSPEVHRPGWVARLESKVRCRSFPSQAHLVDAKLEYWPAPELLERRLASAVYPADQKGCLEQGVKYSEQPRGVAAVVQVEYSRVGQCYPCSGSDSEADAVLEGEPLNGGH